MISLEALRDRAEYLRQGAETLQSDLTTAFRLEFDSDVSPSTMRALAAVTESIVALTETVEALTQAVERAREMGR